MSRSQSPQNEDGWIQRVFLHAARLPTVYALFGFFFFSLFYLNVLFPITDSEILFTITDKIGYILLLLALMTYIYKIFVLACLHYEIAFRDTHKISSLIISNLRKSFGIVFILIAINFVLSAIGFSEFYLAYTKSLINIILIISISWIIIQILYTTEAILFQYMSTLTQEEHLRVKALYTKMRIIRNIATVVIVFITIAVILMSFSSVRNIGISVLASAGFLTAIIGLSAQKTLFSLFSGLQIALSQPIKIGDIVVVENESGIVEEITFTYVTLKLGDRRRLMVPINYFIDKPFENWSHEGNSLRCSLHLQVDYMMPVEPLRLELDRILQTSTYWDGAAKKLQVADINDRSVEIRIQVSASNPDDLSDLRAEVREKMLQFMQKNYAQYFPQALFNNKKNPSE